jgi:ATP-binding cassette subfamily B (MDR/TAP) protein 1
MIERFYDPDQGRVLVDGQDLRELNVKHWRQNVGLVSQEPLLFAGSLRENIVYGKPDATQVELEAAARSANCHDFIMEKGGYDVKVL